jgi:hypothetical protein
MQTVRKQERKKERNTKQARKQQERKKKDAHNMPDENRTRREHKKDKETSRYGSISQLIL